MYSILVSISTEYENSKIVKKFFNAKIGHNWYKDVLLNKRCLKNSVNRIQSKHHRIGTYRINKIFLSCFLWQKLYS